LNQNTTIEVALLSYQFSGGSMILKMVVMTKEKNMKTKSSFKKCVSNIIIDQLQTGLKICVVDTTNTKGFMLRLNSFVSLIFHHKNFKI